MKNIKKFYPLIVGLVLLISVAAYGTRAYFSDSTSEDAGIDLTLGNVDITARSGDWIYIPDVENEQLTASGTTSIGETIKDKNNFGKEDNIAKDVVLKNARPGDAFKKTFTFENTGSLNQIVKFTKNNISKGLFVIKWEGDSLDDEKDLVPGGKVSATMIVTVNKDTNSEDAQPELGNQNTDIINFVGESIEVTAKQTNAK